MRKLTRLNYPRLEAPTFQHTAMFRAVESVLTTDPSFSRTCNLFLSWTGSPDDTKDPAFSFCPYCRLSPMPASSAMATETQHTSPLAVGVELAVQGTDFDQLANFWGLMHYAFFPQNNIPRRDQVRTILMNAGVTRPVVTLQAFGYAGDDSNTYILVGRGNITFNSLLPS